MTIAVDFDGTIVEHKYPSIGKECPFAIDSLKKLAEDGHQLILWTVREGQYLDEAVQWCRERGLEFYAVNSEYPNASWSGTGVSRKIRADLYIDDRNIGGMPDWCTIYDMISQHKSYAELIEEMMYGMREAQIEIYSGSYGNSRRHRHGSTRNPLSNLVDRVKRSRTKFR